MKKAYVIIGSVIVIAALTIFNYERYTDLNLRADKIADYERFNDLLINGNPLNTLIDSASGMEDEALKEQFKYLQLKGKIIYIDRSYNGLVVYKIKHEKVRPIYGPGLNYFSHYLIYSNDIVENLEKYFKDDYKEETFVKADQLNGNWYYVIGEHFSD